MAKILVIGSLDFSVPKHQDFVADLGREIVEQGHDLLNGCRNELDKRLAQSVYACLQERGLPTDSQRLISYAAADRQPFHNHGRILASQWADWSNLAHVRLFFPEPIQEADVVLIVGGHEGTLVAANWARFDNLPLLPVTVFGGAAKEIYAEELNEFDKRYVSRIEKSDYEALNQISSDTRKIAKDAVSLAARVVTSRQVFVIMSFSQRDDLEDAYASFQAVCSEYGYQCRRIDQTNAVERIIPEMFSRIEKAAFIIADLSEPKPNVYFELGFAQGIKKPVVITAYKDTPLPFDVKDIPVIFWSGQEKLKQQLREKIKNDSRIARLVVERA